MRHRYLVAYDITDAKRLRKMYKTMRGYGDALQYSVFLCDLTKQERMLMLEALSRVYHATADRVFIVDLGLARGGGRDSKRIEFLGRKPDDVPDGGAVVV